MRIDAYSQISNIYNLNKLTKTGTASKAGKGNDTVQIPGKAKTFQAAMTAVTEASDVREDKVAKLKAAMESGTYSVSGKEIADKLVEGYFAM